LAVFFYQGHPHVATISDQYPGFQLARTHATGIDEKMPKAASVSIKALLVPGYIRCAAR
jgi:hypothetical protein